MSNCRELTPELINKRINNIEKNIKINERIIATKNDRGLIKSCKNNINNLNMELELLHQEVKKCKIREKKPIRLRDRLRVNNL